MADKTKTEQPEPSKEKAPEQAAANPSFRVAPSPAPIDDSFADGVSGFTVGRNVLKLDLYRIVGYDRESGQEVRTHSHRLVLPLTAISELSNVLQQLEQAFSKMRSEQEKGQGKAG